MLTYLPSGAIQEIGADGKVIKVIGIMSQEYGKYSLIMSRFGALAAINTNVAANYISALKSAQSDVDNGKVVVAPVVPKMKVITDEGDESEVDFNPPLPTLKPKAASPGDWNTGHIETRAGTVDVQAETYTLVKQNNAMLKAMYNKEFPNG